MSVRRVTTFILTALWGGVLALPVTAQRPSAAMPGAEARLAPDASETARASFRAALYQAQNVDPTAARREVAAALRADPQFGLARVLEAFLSVGTPAEREQRIEAAMANLGSASVPEVLLAVVWREQAAGRGAEALPVLRTLAELVPADADVAYLLLGAENTGKPVAEQVANTKRFLERFPMHAAAHNSLAYQLWNAGDPTGALAAVGEYARLAPNHVNSHDSYADILLLERRPQEALAHVKRELELNPNFVPGQAKLGTVHLMLGDIAAARAAFASGLAAAPTPDARYQFMYWQAAADVYARDGRAAVRKLEQLATEAAAADDAAAAATAQEQAGVIEAYLGNRRAVAGHFDAAMAADADRPWPHYLWKAIALSRAGDAAGASAAETQLHAMPDHDPSVPPYVNAILALDARSIAAAEAAAEQIENKDQLSNAIRAEIMIRKGQRAEGEALRQEVLASTIKQNGNSPVSFPAQLARLRAQQIR